MECVRKGSGLEQFPSKSYFSEWSNPPFIAELSVSVCGCASRLLHTHVYIYIYTYIWMYIYMFICVISSSGVICFWHASEFSNWKKHKCLKHCAGLCHFPEVCASTSLWWCFNPVSSKLTFFSRHRRVTDKKIKINLFRPRSVVRKNKRISSYNSDALAPC